MVVPAYDPIEVDSLDPDTNPLPPCLENLNDPPHSFGANTAGATLLGNALT